MNPHEWADRIKLILDAQFGALFRDCAIAAWADQIGYLIHRSLSWSDACRDCKWAPAIHKTEDGWCSPCTHGHPVLYCPNAKVKTNKP